MINHTCVSFSAVQIYELSFIHLYATTLLTYPVSTCTADSFNSMKRLKTTLRSTMTDKRLSSLAILHFQKHKDVDADDFITEFARLKGGHLAIC